MPASFSSHDAQILRNLATRKVELSETDINHERREAWYRLDADNSPRPMVLAEIGAIQDVVKPVMECNLACEGKRARQIEFSLKQEIYQFEVLKDDHVIEPWINIPWQIQCSDFGVCVTKHSHSDEQGHGSWKAEPPLKNLEDDFEKLRHRTFSVDRDATQRQLEELQELFAGVVSVRIRGSQWWTMGMTIDAIDLIGLEELMMAMYDDPEGLHRLMAFLRDDYLTYARWLEAESLLTADNENDYIGSGSMGYTQRLKPVAGHSVCTRDKWVLLESQETVGVGPEQFSEFIFPYQQSIAEVFGSVYYGCCEPVHSRWHVIQQMKNLARISVSPWCDESFMAGAIGRRFVYSRKPNPTQVSTDHFDETQIRADLRKTLDTAKNCRLEIIMKDVHTLRNQPGRLPRWVEIAREEIAR